MDSIDKRLAEEIRSGGGPAVEWDWQLSDAMLSRKEKVELLAILREALVNVQKHAEAVTVKGKLRRYGWRRRIPLQG